MDLFSFHLLSYIYLVALYKLIQFSANCKFSFHNLFYVLLYADTEKVCKLHFLEEQKNNKMKNNSLQGNKGKLREIQFEDTSPSAKTTDPNIIRPR